MKSTRATVDLRIAEVVALRVDGADYWDVRDYVRQKQADGVPPWELDDSLKILGKAQLWRYINAADELIASACQESREELLRRHLARRRSLYNKALADGDVKTALAVAKDEAELLDLYPARKLKQELTGAGGGPIEHQHGGQWTEAELLAGYRALCARLGKFVGEPPDQGATAADGSLLAGSDGDSQGGGAGAGSVAETGAGVEPFAAVDVLLPTSGEKHGGGRAGG